jgi:hypothetical protein
VRKSATIVSSSQISQPVSLFFKKQKTKKQKNKKRKTKNKKQETQ